MEALRPLLEKLKEIPGIEAAFILGNRVYAIARELEDVDWEKLLEVEDQLLDEHSDFEPIGVWAHQGRDINQMFPGWERLF